MTRTKCCLIVMAWLAGASPPAMAASDSCEAEARPQDTQAQHFMVLAGRNEVFYDRSGPAFVMLIKSTAEQVDIGALGIYADAQQLPRFGAVPASTYEAFMEEPDQPAEVMLRLRINAAQYQRALGVLTVWDRRVRESALLYPDISLDNILLVKQATEELNRCTQTITPYPLDWGLDDEVSEHNPVRRIPFEYFRTLRQLNQASHVADADVPAALLDLPAVASNPTASITTAIRE